MSRVRDNEEAEVMKVPQCTSVLARKQQIPAGGQADTVQVRCVKPWRADSGLHLEGRTVCRRKPQHY